MDRPLLSRPPGDAAESEVSEAAVTEAGEYEDLQRDLRRFGRGDKASGLGVGVCHSRSLPNLLMLDSQGLKASHLTHIGGFRREFIHRQDGGAGAEDARELSLQALAAQEETLAARINFNMRLLVRFFGEEDAYLDDDGGGLFEDRTTKELELAQFLEPTWRKRLSAPAPKRISAAKACLATFKAFVGTAILFMPQAVSNAGFEGAVLLLVASGITSTVGVLLLGECHQALPRQYTEMARFAVGKVGYAMVGFQLVISQFCFCTCYLIFVVNVIRQLIKVYNWPSLPVPVICCCVAVLMVPFGWIRRIGGMKTVNLLGDAIIMLVLIYVSTNALLVTAYNGISPTVVAWNPSRILCFLGTAIYSYEGIALAIPIRESMEKPELFPYVICGMLSICVVLLASFGLVGYFAWGQHIEIIVLNELPGPGGTAVQVLYSCVLLCTFPIAIYPTFSICEAFLFHGMCAGQRRKWLKNGFRTSMTIGMGIVGFLIENNLSIFVSILGSFCSIPLAIIFPALLHLRIVGTRNCLAVMMAALGMCLIPSVLYIDISMWGT